MSAKRGICGVRLIFIIIIFGVFDFVCVIILLLLLSMWFNETSTVLWHRLMSLFGFLRFYNFSWIWKKTKYCEKKLDKSVHSEIEEHFKDNKKQVKIFSSCLMRAWTNNRLKIIAIRLVRNISIKKREKTEWTNSEKEQKKAENNRTFLKYWQKEKNEETTKKKKSKRINTKSSTDGACSVRVFHHRQTTHRTFTHNNNVDWTPI